MLRSLLAGATALVLAAAPAHASLLWDWSYSDPGISAAGTFTTGATANAEGFYQISGITGERNDVAITGLTPVGTYIPGNAPYAVDDLVGLSGPQLTTNGFGFSLANSDYSNPFLSDGYFEYLSVPPYPQGQGQEVAISFSATLVPEPGSLGLLMAGALAVGAWRNLPRRRA